jgi:hypothetical protein
MLGDRLGTVQQVGRPTLAGDRDGATQRRAVEAEGVAEHLRAREPGAVGALRQRGGGRLEVGVVDLDPAALRLDERAGLFRQPRDVLGGQLDVVEHRRPAHARELLRADGGLTRFGGGDPQRGRRLLRRQRWHPHLEARGLQDRADGGHHLPRLVL